MLTTPTRVPRSLLLLPVLVTAEVAAQCPFQSVTVAPYGSDCPLRTSPRFAVQWQPTPCTIEVTMTMLPLVFGTPLGGFVAFGITPTQQVWPGLGSCARMAAPITVVVVDPAGRWPIAVPPNLPPMTFHVDGVAFYALFGQLAVLPPDHGVTVRLQ